MWFDLQAPIVIAHRGASLHAPENTLAAFDLAVRSGADAIEFDLKLTSDGEVVVLHDPTVDRTTDGSGRVMQMTLAQVRALDAGAKFAPQFRGERIPTLDEVFSAVGSRVCMNIELANYASPFDGLVARVAEVVKKHQLQNRILFSSFLDWNLNRAHRLLPEVPVGLLTMRGWMGWWGRTFTWRRNGYQAFHPFYTDVAASQVDRAHAAGKRVNVWTVNAEADMRRMIGLGIDALITDDPALACRLLGRAK